MSELEDLRRRLRIIEGALGLDLDFTTCSGDPTDCPSDPCTEETCPIRNNALQLLLARYDHLAGVVDQHHHLVQELQETGLLSAEVWTLVNLAIERDLLLGVVRRASQITGEALKEVFNQGLQEKKDRLQQVEHSILKLRATLRNR